MSSDISSKNGTKVADVKSPYTHEGLTYDRTYYYVVTAVNGYGESVDSDSTFVLIPNYLQDICVAMGDSITAGYGVDYAASYVPRLSGNWGKAVYNEGVNGALSSYGASRIDGILARYNPKYITILYGTNDAGFYNAGWTIGNLRYIIQRAKAYGTVPVIATLPPVFGQWAWRKPSDILLNQMIRQLASEEGVNCADVEASLNWNSAYILEDGLHPNSEGHRRIASTFHWALTH
jgi:lysophospholipase L1-like esterase